MDELYLLEKHKPIQIPNTNNVIKITYIDEKTYP